MRGGSGCGVYGCNHCKPFLFFILVAGFDLVIRRARFVGFDDFRSFDSKVGALDTSIEATGLSPGTGLISFL